ncbi:heterokaryon incompatibility protein-domain-containing protein [Xylariaceae sp. FL1019]|nr:heterokaryon incompatibility protein-domain-containing protein [Xylariaceae sp. FL1019]
MALSYIWGDPDGFMQAKYNDGIFSVTQNLFGAIEKVVRRYPTQWIWAGGLCINQLDIEERAQQVQLVGDINSKAALVVAHPGHYRYQANVEPGSIEESDDFECPGLKGDFDRFFEPVVKDSESESSSVLMPPSDEDMRSVIQSIKQKHSEPDSKDEFRQEALSIMIYLVAAKHV